MRPATQRVLEWSVPTLLRHLSTDDVPDSPTPMPALICHELLTDLQQHRERLGDTLNTTVGLSCVFIFGFRSRLS